MRIASLIKGPRRVRRVAHIARKGAAHGLGFLIGRLDLERYLPTWLRLPRLAKPPRAEDLARRFAEVLEELGPTFVKFGQMLATRPDLLPPEYIHELERITHHVAPFSGEVSRGIVEEELGRPVGELFRGFNDEPIASGSIAQVHEAALRDGTAVVVKVRRPRIERVIEDDLAILTFLADQADRVEDFQPLKLPMLVEEFGRAIMRELDFITEAAYTHRFHESFRADERIEIPAVCWDMTTDRVLTMHRMRGRHLGELLQMERFPGDRRQFARTILDAYLRQIFVVGIFHGDPHTGNIFLTEQGRVGLLDFGLMGRVGPRLRRELSVCLLALGNGQIELVAEVISEIGQLPDEAQAEEFRNEVAGLLERQSSVPLERLDMQRSFQEVMDVVRKYSVEVPRDFVLLGRAAVVIGGVVTQLDPAINMGELAVPYGRKLMTEKLSLTGLSRSITSGSYHLGSLLADAPRGFRRTMQKLQRGLFEFTIRHEGFEKGLTELDQTGNRLSVSILLAAIIMASAIVLSAEIAPVQVLGSAISLPGLAGMAFGFLLGIWLIVSIIRAKRL